MIKRLFFMVILWAVGSCFLPLLFQKVLWFAPSLVEPNPLEFMWLGKCGKVELLERGVLLRYTGKGEDYPVEAGAIRNSFPNSDCDQCFTGDLDLLRTFMQNNSRYEDVFLENTGKNQYKLRVVVDDLGGEEKVYHYRCIESGPTPIWASETTFGVPVPTYGTKAMTYASIGWGVILLIFGVFRRRR